MLVMVDLPFVDLRAFSEEGKPYRLLRPSWPLPVIGYEFVRRFGVVRRHPGGGIMPWTGEEYYCDASRAVVFDKPLRSMAVNMRLTHRCRRLFTNGIVGRVELEFHCPLTDDLQGLVAAVGNLNVRVGKAASMKLINAGGRIASEYATATRPISLREDKSMPRLVVPGLPMIALEHGVASPSERKQMRKSSTKVSMEHSWSFVGDSETALWSIRHTPSASADEVRRARRHAIRYHCEIEAFAAALRATRSGQLAVDKSPDLKEYLYASARRLLKNKFDGLPQASILRSIAASRNQEREGELASLEETFRSVNPGALRMLREASQLLDGVGAGGTNIYVSNGGSITVNSNKIGKGARVQGVVGNNNIVTNSSFGDSLSPEIVALVTEMMGQLRELEPQLSGAELQLAEMVQAEVSRESPAPGKIAALLNSILAGVQKVGEAGAPVADTIGKILEMVPG